MPSNFPQVSHAPPAAVQQLTVTLTYTAAGWPATNAKESRAARYNVRLVDAEGQVVPWRFAEGDLIPHLSTAERNALIAFLDGLLAEVKQRNGIE